MRTGRDENGLTLNYHQRSFCLEQKLQKRHFNIFYLKKNTGLQSFFRQKCLQSSTHAKEMLPLRFDQGLVYSDSVLLAWKRFF